MTRNALALGLLLLFVGAAPAHTWPAAVAQDDGGKKDGDGGKDDGKDGGKDAGEDEDGAKDPGNGVPRLDLRAGGNEKMRYFLHGPLREKAPKDGWKLAVILPGGGGGEGFANFTGLILKHSLGEEYLVAQPVSVEWTEGQFNSLVWPTQRNPAKKMEFTTEDFVDAVVRDVKKRHEVDPRHRYLMGWSSSGPPTYTVSLGDKPWFTGYFVSQSVWYPEKYGSLKQAKGRAYWIDHAREDATCKFELAEEARDELKKRGATVEFAEQKGGHGWTDGGPVYPRIAKGFRWLEKNHARPVRK